MTLDAEARNREHGTSALLAAEPKDVVLRCYVCCLTAVVCVHQAVAADLVVMVITFLVLNCWMFDVVLDEFFHVFVVVDVVVEHL